MKMKKMFKFSLLPLVAAIGVWSFAQQGNQGPTLKIGDTAPKLEVGKFVKGTPITKFEPGKVYVVEFWATWCGPCIDVFPHLSEVAKKFEGKVEVIGVNIGDKPKECGYTERIEKFVKEQGNRMKYSVVTDTQGSAMQNTWFAAAGQQYIPCAMIVDKEGKLFWIGSPNAGLTTVIQAALDK